MHIMPSNYVMSAYIGYADVLSSIPFEPHPYLAFPSCIIKTRYGTDYKVNVKGFTRQCVRAQDIEQAKCSIVAEETQFILLSQTETKCSVKKQQKNS